ncbi:hypothetical protein MBLNU459_g4922t1 [Dothideomycetes sp. NU459]
MPDSAEQSPHFQERRAKGLVIVTEAPKFDLESYAANYDHHTRIARLRHIAQLCPPLALEALHVAIPAAKHAKDTQLYLSLVTLLHGIQPSDGLALPDLDWVDKTNRMNEQETERLEQELRGYKNNLIKESIRMGQEDLGTHFLAISHLDASAKAYQKMREYCGTPKHITEMATKLAYISITSSQWIPAFSNAQKMRSSSLKPEDKSRFDPVAQACLGLASLGQASYRDAASSFLAVDPSFASIGPVAGIDFSRAVMTANDIAVYGGLCALASMDRQELQASVLDNVQFRNFLELEPHIRRAISFFCGGKYSQCLATLEAYRNDYLLDLFLSNHVNALYRMIRSKSIVQYFIPFSSVTLSALASAFPRSANAVTGPNEIEEELVDMIQRGVLYARIDTVNRVLVAPPRDSRADAHSGVTETADEIENLLRLKLLRINMTQAGLEIQASKSAKHKAGMSSWNQGLSMVQ